MADLDGAGDDLDRWLRPFLEVLGHKRRQTWAPLYLRGLMGPGERKSLQPMAARLGLSGHDQLHHFIASPAWDHSPLWRVLAERADRLLGGPEAVLAIDDTALPKKGELSVGVARQYCGCLGKRANCQVLVSLTLAQGEVPIPVGLRLFLPEQWTADPERCARAGVPEAEVEAHSKGEIALAELDRLLEARLRFGLVLADAGYGASAISPLLWRERRVPPWAGCAAAALGGGCPTYPEGLHHRSPAALAPGADRPATQDAGAE
jgi:SRSO17 transposase